MTVCKCFCSQCFCGHNDRCYKLCRVLFDVYISLSFQVSFLCQHVTDNPTSIVPRCTITLQQNNGFEAMPTKFIDGKKSYMERWLGLLSNLRTSGGHLKICRIMMSSFLLEKRLGGKRI